MKYKPYKQLVEEKLDSEVSYSELLLTTEWQDKREEILKRDYNRCSKCSLSKTHDHYDAETKTYSGLTDNGEWKKHWYINKEGKVVKGEEPVIVITDKKYVMHVHHKYYIKGKLPWEYKNDALITLCNWCHQELHDNEDVPIFSSEKMIDFKNLRPCDRCNGSGYLPEFVHVQNGVCFKCNGERFSEKLI